MIIEERLRALRDAKKFSQGEVEKRSGLFRCCISRVEHGHTVPAVETLEKFARALEVERMRLGRTKAYGANEMPAEFDTVGVQGPPCGPLARCHS
jgi:transcriptional regulator with XRE-family HTH domain